MQSLTSEELRAVCTSALDGIRLTSRSTDLSEASNLWKEIFDGRENFPGPGQILNFRSNGATDGVGDPKYRDQDHAKELFDRYVNLLRIANVPKSFVKSVHEPVFGSPWLFYDSYYDVLASPNFMKNMANAFRIVEHLKSFGTTKDLNICEIGSGYGCLAMILHQLLEIKSYTIVDLPLNLYLSTVYLRTLYPGCSVSYSGLDSTLNSHFIFSTPEQIGGIKGPFDLVVNTDSLGEMPKKTAQFYVSWIPTVLSENGIFHSDNRYATPAMDGVHDLSEFGYDAMTIVDFTSTLSPTVFFNQLHHICLLAKKTDRTQRIEDFSLLSKLSNLGFRSTTVSLYKKALSGDFTAKERQWFSELSKFFSEPNVNARRQLLKSLDALQTQADQLHITSGLKLMLQFCTEGSIDKEDGLLALKYLANNDHIHAVILFMLAVQFPSEAEYETQIQTMFRHFAKDLTDLKKSRYGSINLKNYIRFGIGMPLKKVRQEWIKSKFLI